MKYEKIKKILFIALVIFSLALLLFIVSLSNCENNKINSNIYNDINSNDDSMKFKYMEPDDIVIEIDDPLLLRNNEEE